MGRRVGKFRQGQWVKIIAPLEEIQKFLETAHAQQPDPEKKIDLFPYVPQVQNERHAKVLAFALDQAHKGHDGHPVAIHQWEPLQLFPYFFMVVEDGTNVPGTGEYGKPGNFTPLILPQTAAQPITEDDWDDVPEIRRQNTREEYVPMP